MAHTNNPDRVPLLEAAAHLGAPPGPARLGCPGEVGGDAAQHLVEVCAEPPGYGTVAAGAWTRGTWPSPVHPVVDQGVHTRVGHRQPVEAEIHVADVVFPGDLTINVFRISVSQG